MPGVVVILARCRTPSSDPGEVARKSLLHTSTWCDAGTVLVSGQAYLPTL